jgi:PAS domain S-box-containing protein
MYLEPNIELQKRLLNWSRFLLRCVLVIAAVLFLGRLLNIHSLISPLFGSTSMGFLSAFCFLLCSFSIMLISPDEKSITKKTLAMILASIVLGISILKMMELISGNSFLDNHVISLTYFSWKFSLYVNAQMPLISGVCFALSSISVFYLNFETASNKMPGQILSLITAALGLLYLISYLYQVKSFYGHGNYQPMSIETAICFLMISLAMLYANPGKGIMKEFSSNYTGSFRAWSLIPFAIIIPILLGSLRLLGNWTGIYSAEFGTAMFVLGYIGIILGLLRYIAFLLNRRDFLKRRLEDELRQMEEGFSLLIDNLKDYAIFMVDANGFVKTWNEGAMRINGYTAREIIGKHISTLFTEDEIERGEPEHNLSMSIKHGRFESESWKQRKDSSRFWAEIVLTAIYDNQHCLLGIACMTRDMTERKLAEEQIRYMSRLMEDTSDAIFSTDLSDHICTWNRAAERLFGFSGSEVKGKLATVILRAQNTEADQQKLRQLLAERKYWKGEVVYLRKDDSPLNIQLSISATHKGSGEQGEYFIACKDNTERMNLEKQLRKFNRDLEAQAKIKSAELINIFDRVTDAFIAFDKDGKFTYVNKKAAALHKRTAENLVGKNIWEEFKNETNTLFRENFNKAISSQQNMHFETYSSSLEIWIENYLYPSTDGLSHFFRDITEKKQSEVQIIREKELSDNIINSLPGIFYLFDNNGKFIRWNKNLETVSGYSTSEISAMSPFDLFESTEKAYIIERIEEVSTKGTSDMEADFVTKAGLRIPYYFTAKAASYEDKPCLIGTGINISLRLKAEQQLRLSVQKYKLLFESNPLPMWMLSLPDLSIIDVNESALNHYGYSRQEFLSLDTRLMGPTEDFEIQTVEFEKHLMSAGNRGVRKHKKKDGAVIYVEINSYDFIYEGKKARLLLSNDITEKLISEESLKKSYENIRQLASHLQNIREDERAAIAREIHDQLGQQLTGLKMDISWVSKKINFAKDDLVKQRIDGAMELLDSTIKTVRKIATELRPSIIDDLGAIAAIEWQSQEFEKRSGILTQFRSGMAEPDFPPGMAIGLFRICQESLTNIGRHSSAKNIMITLDEQNEEVVLKIEDDGIGFMVQQIGQKKTLGLLGMRERAQMMGGEVEVTSSPGNGTTLVARIPVQQSNM